MKEMYVSRSGISKLMTVVIAVILVVAAIAGTYAVMTWLNPPSEIKGTITFSQNFPPDLSDAWSAVIQEDLLFQRYGYENVVPWVEGDDINFQTLLARQADIARLAGPYGFIAIEQGAPIKMITPMALGAEDYVFMTHDIDTWEGLAGKKIAVSSFGSMEVLWFAKGLELVGLSLDDVEVIPGGGSGARTAAVASGEFDAAAVHFDQWEGVKDAFAVVNLGWVNDIYSTGLWTGAWVHDDYIARHRDEVKSWLKCWILAVERLYDPVSGKALYEDKLPHYLPEIPSQDAIDAAYELMTAEYIGWPKIEELDLIPIVQEMLDLMLDGEMISTQMDAEDVFAWDVVNEAIEELANEPRT